MGSGLIVWPNDSSDLGRLCPIAEELPEAECNPARNQQCGHTQSRANSRGFGRDKQDSEGEEASPEQQPRQQDAAERAGDTNDHNRQAHYQFHEQRDVGQHERARSQPDYHP